MGAAVTSTIKDGITTSSAFRATPELLIYGMCCALLASGIWLIVATYFELPVSTTHSIGEMLFLPHSCCSLQHTVVQDALMHLHLDLSSMQ